MNESGQRILTIDVNTNSSGNGAGNWRLQQKTFTRNELRNVSQRRMKIKMGIPVSETVTFRNSRFLVGVLMFSAFVCYAMAAGMFIEALTVFFPLHGYTFGRAASGIRWLLISALIASTGLKMWHTSFKMAHYEARLDIGGVHFRLGSKKDPKGTLFPWTDIAAVRHKRVANYQCYGVWGRDGSVVEFTSYTFFRPKKLARQIAARCEKIIEEIK